jgi:hypothetical protein
MKRLRWWAVAGLFGISGLASAQTPQMPAPPQGTGKPNPAKAQGVVPITEFMAPAEYPFAPKPKPSLWKRLYNKMLHPFQSQETTEELPPGVVPTPGVLPTAGYQTPLMQKK